MRPAIPLSAVRIFEAAARRRSFKAAAEELNLSASAVSHGVRKLEESLGVALFARAGHGVALTASGEALLDHVGRALEALNRGLDLVASRGPQLLRLHCAPSFAAQWLTPRLARFLREHPGIEVRLAAGMDYARFTNDEFDADIVYGPPRAEGLVRMGLGEETVTPLCDPERADAIRTPADLAGHTLIQSDNKQVRWPHWFETNGLPAPAAAGIRFDRSFLALAAAADGLGVALESTRLAEREIAAGRLVAPLAGRARDVRYTGHHLVFPPAMRRRAPLRVFGRWLAAELDVPLSAELA
ncbi:LysR substrate-binding domain-containing protein [Methylobacterium sp. NEAU 140]|uniref:LysR substrate-binding domain-containing protein n=1 Tax=Methylobacterium sp. NEAU 140 TaxID=3064945 RepID=UPI0027362532|nr:LysR substrate-binding domain-containing protein [Methylobacterium sp. NEAU 140]MDP4025511.1 LysR substrate-binding domain-containing protein [Methylobacterium sp. NEAU 140]